MHTLSVVRNRRDEYAGETIVSEVGDAAREGLVYAVSTPAGE